MKVHQKPKFESFRRIANKQNAETIKRLRIGHGLEPVHRRKPNRLSPRLRGLSVKVLEKQGLLNPVSTKVTIYNKNTYILKSLGYKPPKSRRYRTVMVELIRVMASHPKQYGMYMGEYNCKKRRAILRMEVKTFKEVA